MLVPEAGQQCVVAIALCAPRAIDSGTKTDFIDLVLCRHSSENTLIVTREEVYRAHGLSAVLIRSEALQDGIIPTSGVLLINL